MKAVDCQSSYLKNIFVTDTRKQIVHRLVADINKSGLDFDSVVFRGMSGALIVPEVAGVLNKPIVLVRKDDGSHSSHIVEGYAHVKKYIIIDDLIYMGHTITNIVDRMNNHRVNMNGNTPECMGIFLYHSEWHTEGQTFNLKDGKKVPVYGFCIKP